MFFIIWRNQAPLRTINFLTMRTDNRGSIFNPNFYRNITFQVIKLSSVASKTKIFSSKYVPSERSHFEKSISVQSSWYFNFYTPTGRVSLKEIPKRKTKVFFNSNFENKKKNSYRNISMFYHKILPLLCHYCVFVFTMCLLGCSIKLNNVRGIRY